MPKLLLLFLMTSCLMAEKPVYLVKEMRFAKDTVILGRDATGLSDFTAPTGIFTDTKDQVWVTDIKTGKIQILNQRGGVIQKIVPERPFNSPIGILLNAQEQVVVIDGGNHQIRIMEASGREISSIGKQGNGKAEFYFPKGIALDPESGNYLVADFGNLRVQEISPAGDYVKSYLYRSKANNQLGAPRSLALYQNRLIVLYPGLKEIVIFNSATAEVSQVISNQSLGREILKNPRYLSVDPDGMILVSEQGSSAILIFDAEGEYQDQLNLEKILTRPSAEPEAVYADASGNLYFSDLKSQQAYMLPATEEYHILKKAQIDFLAGKFDEALSAYKKVIEANPSNGAAISQSIQVLELMSAKLIQEQNYAQAMKVVQQILSLNPSNKTALARLRVLRWEDSRGWMTNLLLGTACILLFIVGLYTLFGMSSASSEEAHEGK